MNTDDEQPRPPAWLERHGEWLTWWDLVQAGAHDGERPSTWSIHLVKASNTERHVWLCRDEDESSAVRFTVEELSRLVCHLQVALQLAENPPEAVG
ncbi:MAG: hypothetical protein AAFU73_15620 [Planctomycetota bacterium]